MLLQNLLNTSELTDAQWGDYWQQLERRWPAFFEGQCIAAPELPLMNDVRVRVQFFEVPHELLETSLKTVAKRSADLGLISKEYHHPVCDFHARVLL